jgi:vacuolar iron transporter family protein
MEHSKEVGLSFGLTSAIITTTGLMVGLGSTVNSKLVVLGGVLTIAVADAFSDSLGIHISEESENVHSRKQIWTSTISTFLAKFLFALTFVVPILFFELNTAIVINIIWGLSLLGVFSYRMGVKEKINPWGVVGEHLLIAVIVIVLTHYLGQFISAFFAV